MLYLKYQLLAENGLTMLAVAPSCGRRAEASAMFTFSTMHAEPSARPFMKNKKLF